MAETTQPPAPANAAPPPTGLGQADIAGLRQKYGYNEIADKDEPLLSRLARRLWGPIPWMIEAAAILSAIVHKWEDLTIILVLLVVNVYIDFRQESKALSALKAIKAELARDALVKRDGQWQTIPARELLPGDVIRLRLGNIVPADAVLVDGAQLEVDQSALTGESLPVVATGGQLVYSNSIVRRGESEAVVTAIGSATYFGKTASLVAKAARMQRSHFQQAVTRIGNFLIALAGVMIALILVVSLIRHDPFLEILRFSMVLAIASIPVALPAVLSVTMAVGALHLARRHAVVSRLVSIEELAGVDVLCSDKTGTLTQNTMTLGTVETEEGVSEAQVLVWAALASRVEDADPLEKPIFEAIEAHHLGDRLAGFTVESFTPFDPVRKMTRATAIDAADREPFEVIKGAPQKILDASAVTDADRARIDERVEVLAAEGNRTIAVARRTPEADHYTFAGILPLFDPPRADSAAMIVEIEGLGIEVKMVTGDHTAIARTMAGRLGLPGTIERADDFIAALEEPDAEAALESAAGVAEVFPEHKYAIVESLKRLGHIVGMTGDGVNDAPALRAADTGIAVSGATDAARAAADLVLLEPGLGVIAEAVRQSREIFGRMMSYALFRLAETTRVILFMTLAIVVFNFYPVTPIMIIILALLNDIPIMAIAYDNAPAEARPVRWNMREVITIGGVLGVAGVISSFLLFIVLDRMGFDRAIIQTIIFVKLDVAGHSTIYVTRTRDRHFWQKPYPSLKFFLPAFSTRIIGTVVALLGIFMEPIGLGTVALIWLYATAWFVFNDFIKVWTYRFFLQGHGVDAASEALGDSAAP
jgi:H+-transporting ATPase